MLLLLMLVLVVGAVLYVLHARGAFEVTQRLVLVAEDSEGVTVGMDLTFSGFPIGRVRRVELGPEGNARILVDVAQKDAHWLRQSSVFTLVRGIVGNTSLRAYSGILTDPPLPDGAERQVLIGDAAAEIPRLLSAARELAQNLTTMTGPESPLGTSLANLQAITDKAKGPGGAIGALFGNEADARKPAVVLDRMQALLSRIDGMVGRADTQVFGPEGVMRETRSAAVQLNALLGDARNTLTRLDGVLEEAKGIAGNARAATTDLDALRGEVETSLRKIDSLINEVNRKWPFARDTEIKLP